MLCLVTACVADLNLDSFHRNYASQLAATGLRALQVEGENGDIRVSGAAVRAIEIRARIETNDPATLPKDSVEISRNGDTAIVASECNRTGIAFWSIQNCGVDYDILYPRAMRVSVTAVNGDVTIIGAEAAVEARTTNGDVTIRDASSDVDANSQQGDVTTYLGSAWLGRTLALGTRFGDIRLAVPQGFHADVQTHTIAGDVDGVSSIPIGSADVRLSTIFGDVTVSRR